ncbi:Rieske (2Fe-2S) protein [Kribbella solani]|uniref:Rieske (2Fe-2S) protein n=1 Tax=Kribbella solani TaxID=236067 RepID=UPI0029B648DE|nr:Rieske (2Fe-2S) protein [Kribbella solani]MDX3006783.1 Rieske (2Fe-2S) protein [Kribbella solani]
MTDDTTRDRRTVLRCAAMAALVGAGAPILAACGGNDTSGTSGGTGTGTAPTGSAPTGSAPTGSAPTGSAPTGSGPTGSGPTGSGPASGTPSAGGGGTVLGPVSDVPVGGGKVFTDAKVVVTQPTAGQYKGFSAICTHQGNPIGSVENGQIVCPFHNSHFSITDGSPVSGPAATPLPAVNVKVQGTNIIESA